MTDHQDKEIAPQQQEEQTKTVRFPELAELEVKIQRRLRSNQRFLERFMDEDYDGLDDDDAAGDDDENDADQQEEL